IKLREDRRDLTKCVKKRKRIYFNLDGMLVNKIV
ncbi:unnamed protein product, partial [Arabidopsis halleri]